MDQERQSRRFKIWEKARQLGPVETQSVAQLQGLLERGVQVLHHEMSGKVVEAVLKYASVSNDLQLVSKREGFFFTQETMLVSLLLLFFTLSLLAMKSKYVLLYVWPPSIDDECHASSACA